MADTVKKSRIVSENECFSVFDDSDTVEDDSLQDIINQEFNQRLKTCMIEKTDNEEEIISVNLDTETNEERISEGADTTSKEKATLVNKTTPTPPTCLELNLNNGNHIEFKDKDSPTNLSLQEEDNYINKEIPSPEDIDEITPPFTNITVTDVDTENLTAKERFLSSTVDEVNPEDLEPLVESPNSPKNATVKDRMFLSTGSAALLFTQTVLQSPMLTPTLTPTDENYDFLQALKQDAIKNAENQEILNLEQKNDFTSVKQKITMEDTADLSPVQIFNESGSNQSDDSFVRLEAELEQMTTPEKATTWEMIKKEESIDNEELSEISAENEVCRQLDSSGSEGEAMEEYLHKIEGINNSINSKDVNLTFLRNEIISNQLQNCDIDSSLDTTNEEIAELTKEENVPTVDTSSKLLNNVSKNDKGLVSKISKMFLNSSDSSEEQIKENPKISPIALEEYPDNFETIKKTKEMFEKKSEESPVLKSNHLNDTYNTVNHFQSSDESEVSEDTNNLPCGSPASTTHTSESSFVETKTETVSGGEKVLKKKKSKKTKKDNEKENISVSDCVHTNNEKEEELLSHVNVKTLCRSFSDLTSIKTRQNEFHKTHKKNCRTKSMSDITKNDYNNIFEHVSVKNLKSSFSKFDALQKKTVLHVRSSDSGKAQTKFNGTAQIDTSCCKACQKQVFQMEQIKAEKAIWHKNCFRCKECNKQLNVDTYQSNDGDIYCKPHFKALFTPKAVEDEPQPVRPRKHELIIRENQPLELPPDVVRASDKPDLGLEELQNLNVKERFQVFEQHESQDNNLERTPSAVNVKRSPSILSKLAKFQSKGMNIGVSDDSLNGVPVEESASEPEEEDDEIEGEDADLIRAKRAGAQREIPLHFNNMSDMMSKWESGNQMTREERREERKQEIQSIRSRLFMGKQGKMKEMYQQAVAESESGANVKKSVLDTELCEGTGSIKDKFERGEALSQDEQQTLNELEEDKGVFETGISKKSRSIFLELDANSSKAPQLTPLSPSKSGADVRRAREAFMNRQASEDVVKASDHVDDVTVKTADISNRFKFFETYKEPEKQRKQFRITPPRDGQTKQPSPDREVYKDPEIVRASSPVDDDTNVRKKTHTATKMLSIFRQMEENLQKKDDTVGPKPLKRFTPPPEGEIQREEESEEDEDVTDDDEEIDETDEAKTIDDDLIEAKKAARAKQLRAKFEKWETNEIQREQNNSSVNLAQEIGEGDSQIESARSLRARFESMRETPSDKDRQPRVKVNRFVDTTNNVEICKSCQGKVYPLEKVSCHNNIYHKNCFKCKVCNAILRMDSYSYNQGLLYCLPHFKRLFAMKGNYESGFGLNEHKEKWNIIV